MDGVVSVEPAKVRKSPATGATPLNQFVPSLQLLSAVDKPSQVWELITVNAMLTTAVNGVGVVVSEIVAGREIAPGAVPALTATVFV
jgi:hypothetical protein